MTPEVIFPFALESRVEVEVLQLGKGKKGGSLDDIDFVQSRKAFVIQVEGILKGEARIAVGKLSTAVINNIYLVRRPAGSKVGYDGLLKQRPVACEGDEEGCVRSFELRRGGVPGWNWWDSGLRRPRKVVFDGWTEGGLRLENFCGSWLWRFEVVPDGCCKVGREDEGQGKDGKECS